MNIDLHNHVVPDVFVRALESGAFDLGASIVGTGKDRRIVHDDTGWDYPLLPELHLTEAKLESMNRKGIDVAAISPGPPMFYYEAGLARAATAARLINDGVAEMVAEAPERLRGIATLPMQHPEAALAELDRIAKEHDCFRGIEIGTTINGNQVADPEYKDILRRAQELKMFVFAHPFCMDMSCGFGKYYFHNLIGNPLETAMMASHLMFSGTLDELPDLRICLAHGGGFLPYQIGRLAHGHRVRPEGKVKTGTSPVDLLRRFYFDALLHHPAAIRFLIDLVGPDRIVLGTDAPYDMGEEAPLKMLDTVKNLTAHERHQICCGTALELLCESTQGKHRKRETSPRESAEVYSK